MARLGSQLFAFLVVAGALGCGQEVRVMQSEEPAPTGEAGSAGSPPLQPAGYTLEQVHAPDEYRVLVRFNRTPPDGAALPTSHHLVAPEGNLEVTNAFLQPDGKTVELTTARQKLGVRYTLTLTTGTPEIDKLSGDFPSADTAKFWAVDFASPSFAEYELVAERREIGANVVIYLEQGWNVGTGHARDFFDSSIYPIETTLFIDAPDMDENGRILLLGLDGGPYYGGYFSPINALTSEEAAQWGYHSNEMEMVYINIVQGYFDSETVVAHEFQHLLYHERHGFGPEDYPYHNEGLAECAVNAVNGYHPWALDYLVSSPQIASGLSITDWQFGNYDQYVLSYVFWSYIAGQIDGVSTYGDLFDTGGHPQDIEQFLMGQLGITFSEAQFRALIASWAQEASGTHGFNGVLNWPGKPPTWFGGPLSLAPLAGSWLSPSSPSVDYPGNQGPNIVYAGINGNGVVDTQAPFDVAGGALVVFNQKLELVQLTPEPTGFMPPVTQPASKGARDPAWRHPPPFHPARRAELERWRQRTRAQ